MAKHFVNPALTANPTIDTYRSYDLWLADLERACRQPIESCKDPVLEAGPEMSVIREILTVAGELRVGLRKPVLNFERLFQMEFKLTGLAFKLPAAMDAVHRRLQTRKAAGAPR